MLFLWRIFKFPWDRRSVFLSVAVVVIYIKYMYIRSGEVELLAAFPFRKLFLKILFISRERAREGNNDVREKYRLAASCTCPDRGLNLQSRHMP